MGTARPTQSRLSNYQPQASPGLGRTAVVCTSSFINKRLSASPSRQPQLSPAFSLINHSSVAGASLYRARLEHLMKRGEAIPPGFSSFPPKSHPRQRETHCVEANMT